MSKPNIFRILFGVVIPLFSFLLSDNFLTVRANDFLALIPNGKLVLILPYLGALGQILIFWIVCSRGRDQHRRGNSSAWGCSAILAMIFIPSIIFSTLSYSLLDSVELHTKKSRIEYSSDFESLVESRLNAKVVIYTYTKSFKVVFPKAKCEAQQVSTLLSDLL